MTTTTYSSSLIDLKSCVHSILISSILSNQRIRIWRIWLRCKLCQHEEPVLRVIHLRRLSLRSTRVAVVVAIVDSIGLCS